jgi:hypothetical protein
MQSVLVRSFGSLALWAGLLLLLCGTASAAPPANDAFADAIHLSGDQAVVLGSTEEATLEAGEPDLGANRTVWYRWHTERSGIVSVRCAGWSLTKLGVYTGTAVGALSEVASARAGCLDSLFAFRAAAGHDYQIAVAGEEFEPEFELLIERTGDPPANDDFADATKVLGNRGAIRVTTEGASREPGEPWHAGSPFGSSIWLRWTAQQSGTASIYPCEGSFHPAIEAFTGGTLDSLAPVSQGADGPAGESNCALGGRGGMDFPAVAGQTYSISIDGSEGLWGWVDIYLSEPPPPPGPSIVWIARIKVHRYRANFRFGSNYPDSEFRCRLDRHAWHRCVSPRVYKHLAVGRHRFTAVAVSATGGTGEPVTRSFRIRPVKRSSR